MFVKIINRAEDHEITYDCKRVSIRDLRKEPKKKDEDPALAIVVIDVGEQDERELALGPGHDIIYMNTRGKTIDRRVL